jgi:hypothetical protein
MTAPMAKIYTGRHVSGSTCSCRRRLLDVRSGDSEFTDFDVVSLVMGDTVMPPY